MQLDTILDKILERKAAFSVVFILVFAVSYAALYAFDFYPEPPDETSSESETIKEKDTNDTDPEPARLHLEASVTETQNATLSNTGNQEQILALDTASLPTKISFPTLERSVSVLNPESRQIVDLDAALLNGAVRHPDSATFTNEGTIFLLGHSSYLPNVMNKNFQAFNGIQNLVWGDTIELESEDTIYVYRVEKVYKAKASDLTVPIAGTGPKLVIATCNSFASKDDRYIVEAKLVSDSPIL